MTKPEAKKLLTAPPCLPLASLETHPDKRDSALIGLSGEQVEGHTLVVGATRSGKGMHLTRTLLSSNCAMVVVDPKGEQMQRTAGYRAESVGPVYQIPGSTLDLAAYYDLAKNDDLAEMHFHLMKPWADKQPIFAEKCKFLFAAAGAYARQHQLNPLQVLLDTANSAPAAALTALCSSDYDNVMNFTNGDEPDNLDKFAASSWGNFSTRMFDYQQHWATITGQGATIPVHWAEERATIYITYPFDVLKGVGGAVSGMIAALMRYQKLHDRRDPILVAVDELPAVGLRNVSEYLATVGGYNISMLLYVQAYSQLAAAYGERGAETILSNCHHQVWYPPADMLTAKRMSEVYGSKLEPFQSYSSRERDKQLVPDLGMQEKGRSVSLRLVPALAPEEMSALPPDAVIVQMDRRHLVQAYRLWPVSDLADLPPLPYQIESTAVRPAPHWKASDRPLPESAPAAVVTNDDAFIL